MKIVFLDRKTVGDDLDLSKFVQFGQVVFYDFTNEDEVEERVKDADIIITNKVLINKNTIGTAKNIKLVCVTATGTNNLDKDYLESRNIKYKNVANYSTEAVAQHTFAMLFFLLEHLSYYDNYVKSGKYSDSQIFTHFDKGFNEIKGKTWGIIGLGNIGKRVAQIASVFGAKIIYYSASNNRQKVEYEMVDFDTLLSTSDFITIHAPLNEKTHHLMNLDSFNKMKRNAILINVGRGSIIVEKDLVYALENDIISAAGLDVLDEEPINKDSLFLKMKDSSKLLITPHNAWASFEARTRLLDITFDNIKEFIQESDSQ